MVRGVDVARFAAANPEQPDGLLAWRKVPGVGDLALEEWLKRSAPTADSDAGERRVDVLAELLAARPMSSTEWLSLAGMAFATGQPPEKSLAALTMSWLTGPNEGSVMVPRAIFGLLRWEALPDDARRRTTADLAEVVREKLVSDVALDLVKRVVTAKPAEARSEIAGLLQAEQMPGDRLSRLGL
jgi:hypothetical protein